MEMHNKTSQHGQGHRTPGIPCSGKSLRSQTGAELGLKQDLNPTESTGNSRMFLKGWNSAPAPSLAGNPSRAPWTHKKSQFFFSLIFPLFCWGILGFVGRAPDFLLLFGFVFFFFFLAHGQLCARKLGSCSFLWHPKSAFFLLLFTHFLLKSPQQQQFQLDFCAAGILGVLCESLRTIIEHFSLFVCFQCWAGLILSSCCGGDVEYLLQFLFSKLYVTPGWGFFYFFPLMFQLKERFTNINWIFAAFEGNILKVQCSREGLNGNLRNCSMQGGSFTA